ncbi:hypothetical protein KEJ19_01340 [Candidatus Bathyarchaeota archaeon]|nr:hypothetical protein [Candidatus Bathyarchaeota archaeon]
MYLDKYVREISKPEDVVGLFEGCKRGRHHLDRVLRNLLKFYQIVEGYPEPFIEGLQKSIPRVRTSIDYREPTEEDVVETFRRLAGYPPKYGILYLIILDGGMRLEHALYMLNSFEPGRPQEVAYGETGAPEDSIGTC